MAAEVVWLEPPSEADAARVAAFAGAERGPLSPAAFRAVLTKRTKDDRSAIEGLVIARQAAKEHESVLDGELKILAGLEAPLQEITLLADADDREVVVSALLYQGFAVDRFWGSTLGEDPGAAPWRITIDDAVVERPWLDAYAIAPLRPPTARDISEAPQRDRFEELRSTLAKATRARVLAPDLPAGAVLVVDGQQTEVDDLTVLELVPGQHWFHVELNGHVVARHKVRLSPGQRFQVELPVPQEVWDDLLRHLRTGERRLPGAVRPAIEAMDGEVWFAEKLGDDIRAWKVTPEGAESVEISGAPPSLGGPGPIGNVSVAAWAGPVWLNSPDFRDQLSDPPEGAGVVNAIAPAVGLELAWDRDWLRYGLGIDLTLPLGEHHVALSAGGGYRLRPTPYLLLGHPLVQASFGFLAPYHLVGGVEGAVPLGKGPLEIRAHARWGRPPPMVRADGTTWEGRSVTTLGVGLGARLRPR